MISVLLLFTCAQAIVLRAPTEAAALKNIDNADLDLESADPNDPVDILEREIDEANANKFAASAELIKGWTEAKKAATPEKNFARVQADAKRLTAVCTEQIQNSSALRKECADPWFLHKDCSKAFEVPSYRLGDLFYGYCNLRGNTKWTLTYFPDSVAGTYLKTKHNNKDFRTLRQILDSEKYAKYEKPDSDTAVVHVRGYDAFTKSVQKNGGSYIRDAGYYRKVSSKAAARGLKKVVILTGDHRLQSSSNADSPFFGHDGKFSKREISDAVQKTEQKISQIRSAFESNGMTVTERVNGNADCDFIFMSNAHTFIPASGTFDNLIMKMATMNGGTILA